MLQVHGAPIGMENGAEVAFVLTGQAGNLVALSCVRRTSTLPLLRRRGPVCSAAAPFRGFKDNDGGNAVGGPEVIAKMERYSDKIMVVQVQELRKDGKDAQQYERKRKLGVFRCAVSLPVT